MLTILALMGLASADEVFVSTPTELVDAVDTAVGERTIWLMPGSYQVSGLAIAEDDITFRALTPRSVILRRSGFDTMLATIEGDGTVTFMDLDLHCGGQRCLEVGGNASVNLFHVETTSGAVDTGGSVVLFDSPGVLTIRDSRFMSADGGTAPGAKGGHIQQLGGTLDVARVFFDEGDSYLGGCVYFEGETLLLSDTTFDSCNAFTGGALYVASGAVDISGNWFRSNDAQSHGGGAYIATEATIDASVFCLGDSADLLTGGGGLHLGANADGFNESTVSNSLFLFNTASRGGAIASQVPSDRDLALEVYQATFVGNEAPEGGDMVYLSDYSNPASSFLLDESNLSYGGTSAAVLGPVTGTSTTVQNSDWWSVGSFDQVTVSGLREFNPGFFPPFAPHCSPQIVIPDSLAKPGAFTAAGISDVDADNHHYPLDCDDTDPAVFPNAGAGVGTTGDSGCDGVDSDCDRLIDEGAPSVTMYLDRDGDGAGDPEFAIQATCIDSRQHLVDNALDCDDTDPDVIGSLTRWVDADGDGYGEPGTSSQGCLVEGFIDNDLDCNDADDTIAPNIPEICDGIDNNCDESIDEDVTTTWYPDFDFDGHGNAAAAIDSCLPPLDHITGPADDCDDTDGTIRPGGIEICDGIDNDCDEETDEEVKTTFFADVDEDTYGDPDNTIEACEVPDGYVATATGEDCDDTRAGVRPGGTERCDGRDNNCDGAIDEDVLLDYYADSDGDGHGDIEIHIAACVGPPGYALVPPDDCDDADPLNYPGNVERCDEQDNNCNDDVDEFLAITFYADADGDFHGDPTVSVAACSAPTGFIDGPLDDCDDADPTNFPGNGETCDERDNDCDGDADEGLSSIWYADLDGDGQGDPATAIEACEQPADHILDGSDCDDGEGTVNVGGVEICDGLDNDCNGIVDDGTVVRFFRDADGDGFGIEGDFIDSCAADDGYVEARGSFDCDDGDATAFPGAVEICDSVDNNCDNFVDEGVTTAFFGDADGDGFGDDDVIVNLCEVHPTVSETGGDCDDSDASIHPLVVDDACNGIDNNCDGVADDAAPVVAVPADADRDGYGSLTETVEERCATTILEAVDCDDTSPFIHPDAEENCDDVDRNCDGNPEPDKDCTNPFGNGGEDPIEEGCGGCASTGGGAPLWMLAAPLLLLRRRRKGS